MNLDLHLTTDCNMACRFCGAWEYGKEKHYISLHNAKDALTAGCASGYGITTLTGGEPTLHPDFCEIIEFAHKLGYWTVITTNGIILTEELIDVYRRCNTLVRISMHTTDKDIHNEITGSDSFDHILDNINRLRENNVQYAIGCTVFDENISQVAEIAAFAWEKGASFIRYTPVVSIRGAADMVVLPVFFEELLKRIFDLCLYNKDKINLKSTSTIYRQNLLEYMLTRKCAGGSRQHIIYDCTGRVTPCSFIPEQMDLCSEETGEPADRFQTVYRKMDKLFSGRVIGKLKGRCSECEYTDTCLGGCFTTKMPFGLDASDEQPVCIYNMVKELLQNYDEKEQNSLLDYWGSCYIPKLGTVDTDKHCMRRLPIWEINFRYVMDRARYPFVKAYSEMERSGI